MTDKLQYKLERIADRFALMSNAERLLAFARLKHGWCEHCGQLKCPIAEHVCAVSPDLPPIAKCPNPACCDGYVPDGRYCQVRCPDCAARSAGQAAFLPKGGE